MDSKKHDEAQHKHESEGGGGHSHSHSHSHSHLPSGGKAFAVGIALNVAFVIAEVIYGISSNSVALVADAAHNMGDVLGLAMAWAAMILAKRSPTANRTYGLRRSTILATLFNAVLLLVAIGGVIWEAVRRLHEPGSVDGYTIIVVAAVGVVVNGVSALFFFKGKDSDANVRGAFLHLAADAAVSGGVVIGGIIILKTGWQIIDPILSLLVSVVILVSTLSLFKDALNLSLDSVPSHIDLQKVKMFLASLPGVSDVHDLHIWSMSTTEVALTAHLVTEWTAEPPHYLKRLSVDLHEKFGIGHSTVQFEPFDMAENCKQAPEESL